MVCIGNLVVQNSWLKLGYAEVGSQLDMIAAVAKWTKAVGPGPIYRGFESHPAAFFSLNTAGVCGVFDLNSIAWEPRIELIMSYNQNNFFAGTHPNNNQGHYRLLQANCKSESMNEKLLRRQS